jgi:hypothetical protein
VEAVSALILAGGWGKRMGTLCRHRDKPGLPFAGNIRVIDSTLSNCRILPHAGPGDFPSKVVPPNRVISPRKVSDPLPDK